jgi:hypothetical protein
MVIDPKAQQQIDSLKVVIKSREEALNNSIIKMQEFDSLRMKEKEERIKADIRSEMLKRALLERLQHMTDDEKRKMILEYYGYKENSI